MSRETADSELTYYPPRARWYRRPLYVMYWLRGALHLESLWRPLGISAGQVVLSVLIPGFAIWAAGRRVLSWVFIGIYCASFIALVLWYGYAISRAGYGLMVAIHASSVFFFLNRSLQQHYGFLTRFVMCVLVLFLVWIGGYSPVLRLIQSRWCLPIEVQGRAVVMKPYNPGNSLRVGQWILFEIGSGVSGFDNGVFLRQGYGFSPILAQPGDTLRFTTNQFFVNGVPMPRRDLMPTDGEHVIAEKHWFAWPELATAGQGAASHQIAARVLKAAMVSEKNILGTPYRRWFWREQLP